MENGVEVRPHHYIRSILHDGPVGINGRLKSGDELLEVCIFIFLELTPSKHFFLIENQAS